MGFALTQLDSASTGGGRPLRGRDRATRQHWSSAALPATANSCCRSFQPSQAACPAEREEEREKSLTRQVSTLEIGRVQYGQTRSRETASHDRHRSQHACCNL
eukprot:354077-Chlamydomonas_euryale.AAC.3